MELQFKNVTKKYGDKVALNNFTVTLHTGIYGILGPNGAGKSTLVNLITDNTVRDGGSILFNGTEILTLKEKFRKRIGYMPQQQGFYEHFTAAAFLKYMAGLKGIKGKAANRQINQLLETVNLHHVSHEKIGSFSGGMRQRVLLAQALLGNPDVIILDEPTAGLDPSERIWLRNFISEISKDKIILFATHVVSDIESIADEVLLIKAGRLVREAAPAALIETVYGKVAEINCTKESLPKLQKEYVSGRVTQRRDGLYLRIVGDNLPKESRLSMEHIDLEDVYLYYLQTNSPGAAGR